LGIAYEPEDLIKKVLEKRDKILKHEMKTAIPSRRISLEALAAEIRELRLEIEKIKRALEAHGIKIE